MGFKRALNSRIVAVAGGAAVLAVLAGGAGFAAGQIDSGDIQATPSAATTSRTSR